MRYYFTQFAAIIQALKSVVSILRTVARFAVINSVDYDCQLCLAQPDLCAETRMQRIQQRHLAKHRVVKMFVR